jgi:hypothetical protein
MWFAQAKGGAAGTGVAAGTCSAIQISLQLYHIELNVFFLPISLSFLAQPVAYPAC